MYAPSTRASAPVLAAVLAALLGLPALDPATRLAAAEEKAASRDARDGKPAAEVIVIEKSLYVPYQQLQAIFEKEGRGIFIPYEEFLRLWRAAQPVEPQVAPDVPPADAVVRGGSYVGTVSGDVARFQVTFDMDALKKGWSQLALPLKGVALESVELSSPGALFSAKGEEYSVFFPAPGRYQAKLQFSVRVAQEPGKKTVAFGVPPVAVSKLEVTIPEEDVRVDVHPTLAVTQTAAQDKSTKVLAFLGNSSTVTLSWMPPIGKLAEGGAILLAEQTIRAYLGERILRLATDVAYQVLRGEVDTLRVRVPEGMRLLSVKGDNIREWAQEAEVLVVKLHSSIKDASRPAATAAQEGGASYRLSLSFERVLDETPSGLKVPFPAVEGVIRESGWVVFGHESGLNVRVRTSTGLSQLDRDEVPEPLRASLGVGFRYLAQPLALDLEVEKITPVIKSFVTSVVSLGKEDDTWTGWIDYDIARAGVFRLEFRVPARWSVVAVGDPSTVEDYETIDGTDGMKAVVVTLKSKALGAFRLPFRLSAQGSAAQGEMTLSPPVVVGSQQDRGLFGVSTPKAINLSTVEREKMTPADVEELFRSGIMTQVGADTGMPLTYGYRDPGPSVKVRLEAKKTEIDVLAQHLVEITDGGIKQTHILDFDILYAAVDRLRFTAPVSLDELLKVEAKEKKEVRKISSTAERTLWEVTLQAPVLGPVSITLNHEMELKAPDTGKPFAYAVHLVQPSEVRERSGFVAVRKEGTLEITPLQSGMESIDATDLPDKLRRGQIYSAFRYFATDPSLSLNLTRYEYQPLATTVVALLHMKSVLSEERRLKTRADLFVQNTDRQYLEIRFAPEAEILSVSVAGKAQQPRQRKEGSDTRLIQIPASAGAGGTFPVVIVYEEPLQEGEMGSFGSVSLATPEVLDSIPVTKVELELYLDPEYAYLGWSGNLHLRSHAGEGLWARFKSLINESLDVQGVRAPEPDARPAPAVPGPTGATVDIDIPTRGYVPHIFETLAPVGNLSFRYVGRTLFSFVDFIAFLVAAGCGVLLLLAAGWRRSSVAVACVFVPLVLVWFSKGPLVEIFTSLFAGGAALFVVLFAARLWRGFARYRASRLAMAPDPFLEEAATGSPEGPATPAPGSTGGEPATTGGGATQSGGAAPSSAAPMDDGPPKGPGEETSEGRN